MPDKQTDPNLPGSLDNFARGLLSTTCLTVACGTSAVAGTVTELQEDAPNETV